MAGTFSLDSCYPVTSRDVEYGRVENRILLARVYQPEGPGPFPLLIDVHGGGWARYDRTRDAPVNHDLASRGMVVASLDFRLSGEAAWPAGMQDIRRGIIWFKRNAAEFKISAHRVGALGFSSGGHQVLMSGMRPGHPRYGLVSQGPDNANLDYLVCCGCAYDLTGATFGRSPYPPHEADFHGLVSYMGGAAQILAESPLHVIQSREQLVLPPLLLCQAGADDLAGFKAGDAARFAEAYSQRGGHVELDIFAGAPHIFLNPDLAPRTEAMERGLDAIRHFIARQLSPGELRCRHG